MAPNEEEKGFATWRFSTGLSNAFSGISFGNTEKVLDFKPERIIFNDRSTICFYKDGTKLVTTASEDEPFIKEFGVAENIVKKIYGTRLAFLRDVEKGYTKPDKKK